MKIEGFKPVLVPNKKQDLDPPNISLQTKAESMTLGRISLYKLFKKSNSTSAIDEEAALFDDKKIDDIKNAIKNGVFEVNTEVVADALITLANQSLTVQQQTGKR